MAFDAGMLAASLCEVASAAVGGRIDRINQPTRDEVKDARYSPPRDKHKNKISKSNTEDG